VAGESNGRAVLWHNGAARNLGTFGGNQAAALTLNDLGHVVGWALTTLPEQHAFIWRDSVMTDLGAMPATESGYFSIAQTINSLGQVAGTFSPGGFVWQNGGQRVLPGMCGMRCGSNAFGLSATYAGDNNFDGSTARDWNPKVAAK
jgi:probable HAF family extracellular repeat protein